VVPATPEKATADKHKRDKQKRRREVAMEQFARKALEFLASSLFSTTALAAAPIGSFLSAALSPDHFATVLSLCHNLSPFAPVTIADAKEKLGPAVPRFQPLVRALRFFVSSLAASPALSSASQEFILERISQVYPLSMPLEIVNLSTRLWIRRTTALSSRDDTGNQDDPLAVKFLARFVDSLGKLVSGAEGGDIAATPPHELVTYEHALEMLFVYSTPQLLSRATRISLLHTLINIAATAAEAQPQPATWVARLALARVLLFAQFMLEYSGTDGKTLPETLVTQLERNILDRSLASSVPTEALPKQFATLYAAPVFAAATTPTPVGPLGRVCPYAMPHASVKPVAVDLTVLPSPYGPLHARLLGLLKLDWRLGNAYISDYTFRAAWAFLSVLPPSQEFLDSIKSPSLFVAHGAVSDVSLYVLSWLVRVAFGSSDDADADAAEPLPKGLTLPAPESIPIASHFRSCMLLLSNISEMQAKETAGAAYHADALARGIILVLYSLLPPSASSPATTTPSSTPPPAGATRPAIGASRTPAKKPRSRKEALEAYHDSIRRYLLTRSSDGLSIVDSDVPPPQPPPQQHPAAEASAPSVPPPPQLGSFNVIGGMEPVPPQAPSSAAQAPPPPPPPQPPGDGPYPMPMVKLPMSSTVVGSMSPFLGSNAADNVRVVAGLVSAYTSYTRERQLLQTLLTKCSAPLEPDTLAVISELVKASLPPAALASLEKLGLPTGVAGTCAQWGEAKYAAPPATLPASPFRSLEEQALRSNVFFPGDHLSSSSVASVQLVIAAGVQFCLGMLKHTSAATEVAQAMAPAFSADEFGFVRRSVCNAIEQVIGAVGVRNHVLPEHMRHIDRFLAACVRVFCKTPGKLVQDHPLEAATLGALTYVASSMRSPMSPLFANFYLDGEGIATLLRLLLVCRVPRAVESLASELCVATATDRSDNLGARFKDKIVALFDSYAPDSVLDDFLSATLVTDTPPTGVMNATADFLVSVARDPSAFGHRLAHSLLRLLPNACHSTAPLPQYLTLLEFVCAAQGRFVDMARAVLNAIDTAGIPDSSAVVPSLPVLLERLLYAVCPEKRGRMPSLVPAPATSAAAATRERSGSAGATNAIALAAKRLPWWTESPEIDRGRVCTYVRTGRDYAMQPWYCCYTCGLTFSEGCCAICARICHAGHDVSFARVSNFFCDCGAGAKGCKCKCLKPRPADTSLASTPPSSSTAQAPGVPAAGGEAVSMRRSMLLDSAVGHTPYDTLTAEQRVAVREELCTRSPLGRTLLASAMRLLPVMSEQRARNTPPSEDATRTAIFARAAKPITNNGGMFRPKRSTKTGIFEVKIRKDRATNPELRRRLESGAPRRLLATQPVLNGNSNGGFVVAAEGDKISFISQEALLQDGGPERDREKDKPYEVKKLAKFALPFDIVGMRFHPEWPTLLAVYGYRECRVLMLAEGKTDVLEQITVGGGGQLEGCVIIDVAWIPDNDTGAPLLALAADKFVQVYDLSRDAVSPLAHLVPPDIEEGNPVTGVAFDANSGTLCIGLASCRI